MQGSRAQWFEVAHSFLNEHSSLSHLLQCFISQVAAKQSEQKDDDYVLNV